MAAAPPATAPDGAEEEEAFPGEKTLHEDEKVRRLILHFALPRTITTCDPAEGRSTEAELNHVLAAMAWGTLDAATAEWTVVSDEPTLDPPHESLLSYAEFVQRTYPTHSGVDEGAREAHRQQAAEKLGSFTCPGQPGMKFRAMYETMVKSLSYSNKALVKAFQIEKPIWDEEEVPEEPGMEDAAAITRFGRHQVLPSFWNLLVSLTKEKRLYSVVFRTFGDDIPKVQREMKTFCQGQHPCYNGQNKTQKPPPMNGDKGSRDMRLTDEYVGRFDRINQRLEFAKRSNDKGKKKPEEEKKPEGEATEGAGGEVPISTFSPTVYEFPPYHKAYAGLLHHVLEESNSAAILDDKEYWTAKDQASNAGKLLLVDDFGGLAETKTQHIFFDGHIQADDEHCVDVRDAATGEPMASSAARGIFTHRVDFYQAVTDPEYFIKSLAACERRMSERLVQLKRVKPAGEEDLLDPKVLKTLPPKEYLLRAVTPALLPALEACQRDRPKDPITFIAFYMLRHTNGYSKSLVA